MDKEIEIIRKEIRESIHNVKESLDVLEKIYEYQAKEILDRDYKWSL